MVGHTADGEVGDQKDLEPRVACGCVTSARRPQVGQHGSASGSILLGLDGFEVTAAEVIDDEWRLAVQTTATTVGCVACGSQARVHARRTVRARDLPIGGRPVVLAWRKRVWRCVESACAVRTWTEPTVAIRPRAVLTERARAEACRRVGKDAHPVAAVARDLGVGWATVMRAVTEHGRPLLEDPGRLEGVAALGLDETSFLKATRTAPTRYVTGLVDLERGRCWMWWPTAPGLRWTAGLVCDLVAAGRHHHGGAGPLAWLRQRPGRIAFPYHRGGGPLPRHQAGQHRGRPGPPPDPAGHPRPSRAQVRSVVPDPQAAADSGRTAHQPWPSAAARGTHGGGSFRRGR